MDKHVDCEDQCIMQHSNRPVSQLICDITMLFVLLCEADCSVLLLLTECVLCAWHLHIVLPKIPSTKSSQSSLNQLFWNLGHKYLEREKISDL